MNFMKMFRQTLPAEAPEVQYDIRTDELAAQKLANEEARANRLAVKLMNARRALNDIIAMETANPAPAAKKMAARARREVA